MRCEIIQIKLYNVHGWVYNNYSNTPVMYEIFSSRFALACSHLQSAHVHIGVPQSCYLTAGDHRQVQSAMNCDIWIRSIHLMIVDPHRPW